MSQETWVIPWPSRPCYFHAHTNVVIACVTDVAIKYAWISTSLEVDHNVGWITDCGGTDDPYLWRTAKNWLSCNNIILFMNTEIAFCDGKWPPASWKHLIYGLFKPGSLCNTYKINVGFLVTSWLRKLWSFTVCANLWLLKAVKHCLVSVKLNSLQLYSSCMLIGLNTARTTLKLEVWFYARAPWLRDVRQRFYSKI